MQARAFAFVLVVLGTSACARPATIQLHGDLPPEVWSGVPVVLPVATALDGEGQPVPGAEVRLTVEPPVVARVEGANLVAVLHGQATLRWQVVGTSVERTAPIAVMVPDAIEIRCPARGCDIKVGQVLALRAEVRRGAELLTGAPEVWSRSAAAVLSEDGPGRFKGVAAGPSKVTLEVGNLSRTVDVRVSATRVDRATLSCAEDGSGQSETGVCRVRVGASQPVLLDLLGDGQPAFGFEPTWTMADKKVARLDGGAIRGVSPGRTKLSVEVGGARAELEVDVWPLACSEKVESKLTYIVGHRGVQLECKVKDPEPCIDFFIKRKWSVPEALGGCCCVGAQW